MGAAMSDIDPLAALDALPDAPRIRSKKLKGSIAALVIDATGLDDDDRQSLQDRVRAAVLALPGVSDTRIVLTASRPGRKIVAW